MYDHPNLTWWQARPHWGGVEAVRPGEKRLRPGMLPITSIPAGERPLLRANLIFPNVPMTTMETSVATYQVIPAGPDTCRTRPSHPRRAGVEGRRSRRVPKGAARRNGTACEKSRRWSARPGSQWARWRTSTRFRFSSSNRRCWPSYAVASGGLPRGRPALRDRLLEVAVFVAPRCFCGGGNEVRASVNADCGGVDD